MTDLRKRAVSALLILVLCGIAAEGAGAAFFALERGGLVWLHRQSDKATKEPATRSQAAYRLHPYFGYVSSVSSDHLTVPIKPDPGDFVVAVFGGSVASNLVGAPRGGRSLREAIQALPSMVDRRVRVIRMAHGGYKQPQQLIALSYLLAMGQHIDLAINVDGFNEFALGYENYRSDVDPSLPAGMIMGPLALEMQQANSSPEYYELAYRASSAHATSVQHDREAGDARTGIAFAYHTVLSAVHRATEASVLPRYQELLRESREWAAQKRSIGIDRPAPGPAETSTERLFSIWLDSDRQMRLLLQGNHVPYLHVVQPNQYFTQHKFSADEAKIALSLPADHSHRLGVQAGYPLLAQRARQLTSEGIVFSLDLFDNQTEAMYIDNCCHYTKAGETLFADFIAQKAQHLLAANEK